MAALVTLVVLLFLGGAMYAAYKSRNGGFVLGSFASGYPDSINARLLAERAVPRPPWPVDEEGNPLDEDEDHA